MATIVPSRCHGGSTPTGRTEEHNCHCTVYQAPLICGGLCGVCGHTQTEHVPEARESGNDRARTHLKGQLSSLTPASATPKAGIRSSSTLVGLSPSERMTSVRFHDRVNDPRHFSSTTEAEHGVELHSLGTGPRIRSLSVDLVLRLVRPWMFPHIMLLPPGTSSRSANLTSNAKLLST